jgi:hypothetical protein
MPVDLDRTDLRLEDVGGGNEGGVAVAVGVEIEGLVIATCGQDALVVIETAHVPLVSLDDSAELVHLKQFILQILSKFILYHTYMTKNSYRISI